PGFHQLHLRFKDANGRWGMTTARTFYKENLTTVVPPGQLANVTKGEYFFDADPGFGKGTNIPLTPGKDLDNLTFAADVTALEPGFHQLHLRFKDANGRWGM
ncbi:hypothetical protein H7U12_22385, partial [Rufibacter sp. H-1]|nr:hypothetical protein [Rufibacter sediminis]